MTMTTICWPQSADRCWGNSMIHLFSNHNRMPADGISNKTRKTSTAKAVGPLQRNQHCNAPAPSHCVLGVLRHSNAGQECFGSLRGITCHHHGKGHWAGLCKSKRIY